MISEHPEWKGKVRIIALSIDRETETLLKHLNNERWLNLELYQLTPGYENGVNANFGKRNGFMGVPHVMLVDKTGTVVFKGHPMMRDLEVDIQVLLDDKKLGCSD
jgi:hypothetical protein